MDFSYTKAWDWLLAIYNDGVSPFVGDCADENGVTTVAWQIYRYVRLLHTSPNIDGLLYLRGLAEQVDIALKKERLFKTQDLGARYRDPVYSRHIELAGARLSGSLYEYANSHALVECYEQDIQFLGAAANLYDAAQSYETGNIASAMASMAGAVLMTMGADLTFRVEAVQLDAQECLLQARYRYESAQKQAEAYKSIAEPFIKPKGAGRRRSAGIRALIAEYAEKHPDYSADRAWKAILKSVKSTESIEVMDSDHQKYQIKLGKKLDKHGGETECILSYAADSFGYQEQPECSGIVRTSFNRAWAEAKNN